MLIFFRNVDLVRRERGYDGVAVAAIDFHVIVVVVIGYGVGVSVVIRTEIRQ